MSKKKEREYQQRERSAERLVQEVRRVFQQTQTDYVVRVVNPQVVDLSVLARCNHPCAVVVSAECPTVVFSRSQDTVPYVYEVGHPPAVWKG